MFQNGCKVYSFKSVDIMTEYISDHNVTNTRNNQETLNIRSCQSFLNFV